MESKLQEQSTFLFIGGPKDGQRRSIPKDRIGLPYKVDIMDHLNLASTTVPIISMYKVVRYYPIRFAIENKVYVIYAFEGISVNDVLEMLISRYDSIK